MCMAVLPVQVDAQLSSPTHMSTFGGCADACSGGCIAVCPGGTLDYAGTCQPTATGCQCVPFECIAENYCRVPEKREPNCCGNGTLEAQFEDCDDGNRYGGDGCSVSCRRETIVTTAFSELLIPVNLLLSVPEFPYGLGVGRFPFSGQVIFARAPVGRGDTFDVAVRSLQVSPLNQNTPTVCIRGKTPPDELFGPGNVGTGSIGPYGPNVLGATVFLEQWLNYPIADVGPDGVACTDDDPGLAQAHYLQPFLQLQLGTTLPCTGDRNGDGQVTIDEILDSVNNALNGCPPGSAQ